MKVLNASHYVKPLWLASLKGTSEEQVRSNIFGVYEYDQFIDVNQLRLALQVVVNNSYNLRSLFVETEGELKQVILDEVEVTLEQYQVGDEASRKELLDQLLMEPFNLAKAPLFRFVLINNAAGGRYTFLVNIHHAIIDGTQWDLMIKSIERFYQQNNPDLTKTDQDEISLLSDYLSWEESQIAKASVDYWLGKLNDYPLSIDLPYRKQGIDRSQLKQVSKLYALDADVYRRLKEFSEKTGYSVFNIMKTLWAMLIAQYSGQDKLVIVYPFNTRRKQFKDIKGCFVNTLLYCFENKGSFISHLKAQKDDMAFAKNWYVDPLILKSRLKHPDNAFLVSVSQTD